MKWLVPGNQQAPTRSSLLLRIRDAGDHTAWEEFVEIYTPLVFGHCRRSGLPEADAADVAQEVMLAVARAIRTFEYDRARGSFRSWLLSVTRNKLRTFVSRRNRQPGTLARNEALDDIASPASPDEVAAWDQEYYRQVFERAAAQVRREVKDLTWQAFWKTAIENRPGLDVARELDMKLGSVYVARKRVLARLQAAVAAITDFGLARVSDGAGLTRSGCLAGTPEYLSPEQAEGRPVDHRADLFSLGCVLYALGTGASPFHADSVASAVRNVCDLDPPPMRERQPDICRDLSDLVERLLQKDPALRLQTAAETSVRLGRMRERANDSNRAAITRFRHRIEDLGATLVRAFRRSRRRFGTAMVLALGLSLATFLSRRLPRPATGVAPAVQPGSPAAEPFAVSPPPGACLLRDSQARELAGFATLADAVVAAADGDEIECLWRGDWITEAIDLGSKPLKLRASHGVRPALRIARRPGPLLRTRAPLELEGLTLKVPAVVSPPGEVTYRSVFGETLIEVVGAPLLLTNCRLEMQMPPGGPAGPVCVVGVQSPGTALFLNSEFYSPFVSTIAYLPAADDAPGGDRLVVQNCVQTGFALVHVKRTAKTPPTIELTGNTAALGFVVGFTDPPAGDPVAIRANRNVFDVQRVVNTAPQSRRSAPEDLLQWSDGANVVQVGQDFTLTRPPIIDRAGWRQFAGLGEGPWPEGALNLSPRVLQLRQTPARLTPEAFLLSATEREALDAAMPGVAHLLGVNPQTCGPGPAYDALSASPAWTLERGRLAGAFRGR